MSNFYFINQNAARTLFPETAKSSNLDPLAFDLAYALERKNARLPKSDPMNGRDVKVLTSREIASFDKQKKEITATRALKGDLALSTLFITAAAVAALALGFYFFPVILFGAAIGLGALAITLGGLALHRHIQYNKKIDALANAVFPVRHQLALAKNFGKADPVKLLQEISCNDLELLSIAAHTASHSTDLGLLKDLISETEQKRKEGQIDDAILLPLYRFTSQLLNSSKKSDHLTKDGKPSAPIVLSFYKDTLNELSANPIPKKLSTLFGVQIVNLLCSSELMLKKGANPVEMTKMMQWINQAELQGTVSRTVDYLKDKDDETKIYVKACSRNWQNQMRFVAEGNTYEVVTELYDLLKEKVTNVLDQDSSISETKQRVRTLAETNALQELVLKKIKQDPTQKDKIVTKIESFDVENCSIEKFKKELEFHLDKRDNFFKTLSCTDKELIEIASDCITCETNLALYQELIEKTETIKKKGTLDDRILTGTYRYACELFKDGKASDKTLEFYIKTLTTILENPMLQKEVDHFEHATIDLLNRCLLKVKEGADLEMMSSMVETIHYTMKYGTSAYAQADQSQIELIAQIFHADLERRIDFAAQTQALTYEEINDLYEHLKEQVEKNIFDTHPLVRLNRVNDATAQCLEPTLKKLDKVEPAFVQPIMDAVLKLDGDAVASLKDFVEAVHKIVFDSETLITTIFEFMSKNLSDNDQPIPSDLRERISGIFQEGNRGPRIEELD